MCLYVEGCGAKAWPRSLTDGHAHSHSHLPLDGNIHYEVWGLFDRCKVDDVSDPGHSFFDNRPLPDAALHHLFHPTGPSRSLTTL